MDNVSYLIRSSPGQKDTETDLIQIGLALKVTQSCFLTRPLENVSCHMNNSTDHLRGSSEVGGGGGGAAAGRMQDVTYSFCCGDHLVLFTAHRHWHRPLSPKASPTTHSRWILWRICYCVFTILCKHYRKSVGSCFDTQPLRTVYEVQCTSESSLLWWFGVSAQLLYTCAFCYPVQFDFLISTYV